MQRKKNAKTFEKEISQKLESKFRISKNWQRLPVQVGFRISNENLGLSEFLWFLRTGVVLVCYNVAKLHTTMWQSPIKVAGADHAV